MFYFNANTSAATLTCAHSPACGCVKRHSAAPTPSSGSGRRGCSASDAQDSASVPWVTGLRVLLPCDRFRGRTWVVSPPSGTQSLLQPLWAAVTLASLPGDGDSRCRGDEQRLWVTDTGVGLAPAVSRELSVRSHLAVSETCSVTEGPETFYNMPCPGGHSRLGDLGKGGRRLSSLRKRESLLLAAEDLETTRVRGLQSFPRTFPAGSPPPRFQPCLPSSLGSLGRRRVKSQRLRPLD